MAEVTRKVETSGKKKASPFLIPSFLINLAAGQVSIRNGFKGPIGSPVTACATSVQLIGDGARLIKSGETDAIICDGAEACLEVIFIAGFAAARELSTKLYDKQTEASPPFDKDRSGFVMSKGAGMVVLETLEYALMRGAKPLAHLAGYGTSTDSYHITSGPSDGSDAQKSIHLTLTQAKLHPENIDYINEHATSTPVGDAAELEAIKSVFEKHSNVAISSTKSEIGDTLEAADAIEAIFSIMALRSDIAPSTLYLHSPDDAVASLNIIRSEKTLLESTCAM